MNRSSLGWTQIATLLTLVVALGYLGWLGYGALPEPPPTPTPRPNFDGQLALSLANIQCEFGPRPTGTPAGRRTGDWIADRLRTHAWEVEFHEFDWNGAQVRNIIGKKAAAAAPADQPVILVGAHYDTRLFADRDPDPALRAAPVPGGNDGASGVAVLLELARVLDARRFSDEVWLVFFDAEDNGEIDGWQWAIGSTRLAEDLEAASALPAAAIIVDMVGDADQRFPFEMNSHPELRQQIWNLAQRLGYGDVFVPAAGPSLIDDHLPFALRGVPSVDIIDFEYAHWHTTQDTCEQLSAASLQRVGDVLQAFLERR